MAGTIPLNPKQQRFVEEFLVDMNASAAYQRAGYKATGAAARAAAARMLTNANILEAIQEGIEERSKRTEVTTDKVLAEWAKLAFLDIRKAFDADGALKPIDQLDPDTAAAIAGLEVEEIFEPDPDGGKRVSGHLKKIKLADKKGALDSIAKHLGMFITKIQVSPYATISDAELRRRIADLEARTAQTAGGAEE
jgi:phage terminase small subunit